MAATACRAGPVHNEAKEAHSATATRSLQVDHSSRQDAQGPRGGFEALQPPARAHDVD